MVIRTAIGSSLNSHRAMAGSSRGAVVDSTVG
jgi:hypothetical protein